MNHFDLLLAKKLAEQSGGGGNSNLLLINFTLTEVEGGYTATCDTEPSVVFDAYRNNTVIIGKTKYGYSYTDMPMYGFVGAYEYEEDDYYERCYAVTMDDPYGSGSSIYVDYYEESGYEGEYTVNVPIESSTYDLYCYWTGADGTGTWEVPSAGLRIENSISVNTKWVLKDSGGNVIGLSDYLINSMELEGFNLNPFTDVTIQMCDLTSDSIILSLANSRGATLMCDDTMWLVKLRIKCTYDGN